MTISNHITLADIHRMPVGQIAALPAGAISLKYADRAQDTARRRARTPARSGSRMTASP